MTDIEFEMNKYSKLIINKVDSIIYSIKNLKELYKTKDKILNEKRHFDNDKKELEKEKVNFQK